MLAGPLRFVRVEWTISGSAAEFPAPDCGLRTAAAHLTDVRPAMAIPFTCECGATFKAKDSFAGRQVTCRACGRKLTVPGAAAGEDESSEPANAAPRVTGVKKPKKKQKSDAPAKGKRNPYEGMTLEERIAARSADTEANRSRIAEILTGDIRPLLVGGTSILLGIGCVALGFIAPDKIGEEVGRQQTLEDAMSYTRKSRQGMGVLAAVYKTFGETGLMVFLVLFGLALIGGGAWFFWTRGGGAEED